MCSLWWQTSHKPKVTEPESQHFLISKKLSCIKNCTASIFWEKQRTFWGCWSPDHCKGQYRVLFFHGERVLVSRKGFMGWPSCSSTNQKLFMGRQDKLYLYISKGSERGNITETTWHMKHSRTRSRIPDGPYCLKKDLPHRQAGDEITRPDPRAWFKIQSCDNHV